MSDIRDEDAGADALGSAPQSVNTEASDMWLAAAAQSGDMVAFTALVERHTDRIYGLALRLLADESAAEDATQETLIRAFRSLSAFRGDASFSTWLYRIALNLCRDQLRRQGREELTIISHVTELWADERYTVDPERMALLVEDRRTLDEALDRLPANYRITLLLHDVEGFTMEEVATLTHVPKPTAKSRLRRARMALVTLLDEQGGDATRSRQAPTGASRTMTSQAMKDGA